MPCRHYFVTIVAAMCVVKENTMESVPTIHIICVVKENTMESVPRDCVNNTYNVCC